MATIRSFVSAIASFGKGVAIWAASFLIAFIILFIPFMPIAYLAVWLGGPDARLYGPPGLEAPWFGWVLLVVFFVLVEWLRTRVEKRLRGMWRSGGEDSGDGAQGEVLAEAEPQNNDN